MPRTSNPQTRRTSCSLTCGFGALAGSTLCPFIACTSCCHRLPRHTLPLKSKSKMRMQGSWLLAYVNPLKAKPSTWYLRVRAWRWFFLWQSSSTWLEIHSDVFDWVFFVQSDAGHIACYACVQIPSQMLAFLKNPTGTGRRLPEQHAELVGNSALLPRFVNARDAHTATFVLAKGLARI